MHFNEEKEVRYMCEYCKDFKTGNCDNKRLISGEMNLGPIGNAVIAFINDNLLEVDIFPDYGGYSYFFEGNIKINYCPMCGTKLAKESE